MVWRSSKNVSGPSMGGAPLTTRTQAPTRPQAQPVSNRGSGGSQVPNVGLLGDTSGTGDPLMPQVPNYLGQAGAQFNNFQPIGLGNTPDFSGMFDHYAPMYNQIGPQIPVNDVISGQQQNQLLNSAIGANRAQRQSSMRDAIENFGSRGFSSDSPALQATSNRLGLNEALANTQARTDIPIQTARQNADYRLAAMQANLGQRNQDIQNFIGLENAQTGRISPLLSALVGLV